MSSLYKRTVGDVSVNKEKSNVVASGKSFQLFMELISCIVSLLITLKSVAKFDISISRQGLR